MNINFVTEARLTPAFTRTLGKLFILMLVGLYLDSKHLAQHFEYGQEIALLMLVLALARKMWRCNRRLRIQMVFAVIIGIGGEYLFSKGLGMYTYRLGNVPHYIPLGHAVVLASVLLFVKTKAVKIHRDVLEQVLQIFILAYSAIWLVFMRDVFGFVMSMAVLLILKRFPRERLFYLSMYLVVVWLEIVGTNYEAWYWPDTAFNTFEWLPSANPPTGISFFYFSLDLGSLWLYKMTNKKSWKRMKLQRSLREYRPPELA
ncbi:hypothetical protein [Nonlabens ponticola]|uniref:Uncharacterized protein n=1 Tax=Nonlabens ponticola TaxID=2496866 RepID=A0A3S9MZJ3_9FLAO|nr:hypothetical protein [Nonlabens ponticola]AZQ44578.1 hypothetical protein EJ995_10105 [Nonlabens ponticola]